MHPVFVLSRVRGVQPLLVSRAFQASAPALAGPGMYALGPVKVGEHPSLFIEPSSAGTPQIGGAGGDQVVDLLKYGLNITAGNGILSGSWLIGTSKAPKRNGTHFQLYTLIEI